MKAAGCCVVKAPVPAERFTVTVVVPVGVPELVGLGEPPPQPESDTSEMAASTTSNRTTFLPRPSVNGIKHRASANPIAPRLPALRNGWSPCL